jgi:RNA polymerase sigma factor (sigma-70 family)
VSLDARRAAPEDRRRAKLPEAPEFTTCVRAFAEEFDFVYRAVRRHGVSPSDAEDLVQDVFVVMWRRWADFRTDRPLRPWLAGIAFHLAQKHGRRRRREVAGTEMDPPDEGPQPEDRLAAAHARRLVLRALAALPDRHRAPIVMHELDGVSVQGLAAELSIPLATAYTRLRRARHAFAAAVHRLKALEPDAALGPLERQALTPAALLAFGRASAPAPAAARERVLARARSVLTAPPPAARSWPLAAGAAAVAATAAVLAVVALPQTPVHAIATAAPHLRTAWAQPSLSSGLIGFWPFDDGTGSTVARDQSGRGHDCVLMSLEPSNAWIDGAVSGALRVGPRGWLECPQPALQSDGAITVAAWVQLSRDRPYHGTLATRQLDGSGAEAFLFGVIHDEVVVRSNAWPSYLSRPLDAPLRSWIHVAFTRSRDGTLRLYVDGAPAGEMIAPAPSAARVESPLLVGASPRPDSPNRVVRRLYGAMDELFLYDRALSAAEISALAHGARPR